MKLILVSLIMAAPLLAQSITGIIVGSVRDPSALPVAGALVTLIQTQTRATRDAKTDTQGESASPISFPAAIASPSRPTASTSPNGPS